ncbi:MAG TPA: A/G-specific adenine glycosylase [Lachnospiraceae bacterium]
MEKMVSELLLWYEKSKRILPWRDKNNPYYTWISEIMLQQTRVEAVKSYFLRFIERLPDIEALAACREDELLKLWEGLGYYNRVRNMQKAALILVENFGGKLPKDHTSLLKLPGIGSYTAGAIASIGHGQAYPAVDGNVLRVWSRLFGNFEDIGKDKTKKRVEEEVSRYIPPKRAGDFNQALMELGATVCLPNTLPKCTQCPLSFTCIAYKKDLIDKLPVKEKKKKRKVEQKTVLVIKNDNSFSLRKRPDKGLLAGLYEFPTLDGKLDEKEVVLWLKKQGIESIRIKELEQSKHIFSHVEWEMSAYHVWIDELSSVLKKDIIFVDCETIKKEYPIASALRAYKKYIK